MKYLPCLSLVIGFVACAAFAHSATPAVAEVELFNGRNLDGWVVEGPGQFAVEHGMLRVNRGTGWLRSVDTFDDCTLIFEFRFLEPRANGGIFVRTAAANRHDDTSWPDNGYQVQCMDTIEGGSPIGSLILYGAPKFQQEIDRAALATAFKLTGEWHHEEIICRGDTIEVVLNGVPIVKAIDIKHLKGHIGIQGENGLMEYRKIVVIRK